MNCVGCNCSEFRPCDAGGIGCHRLPLGVAQSAGLLGMHLFDEAEFSGPALENVTGANENAGLVCPHTKKLYVDGAIFKCVSCGDFFCDEAAA